MVTDVRAAIEEALAELRMEEKEPDRPGGEDGRARGNAT